MANTVAKYQKYAEYQDSGIEWLGEIPSHWFLKKHKYIAEFSKGKNPELLFDNYSDGLYPYLSMDSLRGKTDSKYAEYKKGLVLVQDNQPLIIWDGSNSGEFVLGRKGLLSSTMASACLIYEIQDKYYWYLCVCIEPEMRKHATGMGIPHVNGEELRGIVLPLPELNEQTQIAKFLDHETTKIDHLIEKQHQLIELLKEKRQAVISHAVTKGLDPNVPMKDSGVEWLGEVPEHWDIVKLSQIAVAFNGDRGANYPSGNDFVDEGIYFISANEVINAKVITETASRITQKKYDELGGLKIKKGDIIYCLRGAGVGKNGICDFDEGTVSSSLMGIRSIKLDPDYLVLLLNSSAELQQRSVLVNGSVSPNLSAENVIGYKFAIPAVDEQIEIKKSIELRVNKIEILLSNAEQAIQLMQERRTALISAAVTGKIDVRNWQAPMVAEADTELSA